MQANPDRATQTLLSISDCPKGLGLDNDFYGCSHMDLNSAFDTNVCIRIQRKYVLGVVSDWNFLSS